MNRLTPPKMRHTSFSANVDVALNRCEWSEMDVVNRWMGQLGRKRLTPAPSSFCSFTSSRILFM